jgi:hypothetical protein
MLLFLLLCSARRFSSSLSGLSYGRGEPHHDGEYTGSAPRALEVLLLSAYASGPRLSL